MFLHKPPPLPPKLLHSLHNCCLLNSYKMFHCVDVATLLNLVLFPPTGQLPFWAIVDGKVVPGSCPALLPSSGRNSILLSLSRGCGPGWLVMVPHPLAVVISPGLVIGPGSPGCGLPPAHGNLLRSDGKMLSDTWVQVVRTGPACGMVKAEGEGWSLDPVTG